MHGCIKASIKRWMGAYKGCHDVREQRMSTKKKHLRAIQRKNHEWIDKKDRNLKRWIRAEQAYNDAMDETYNVDLNKARKRRMK